MNVILTKTKVNHTSVCWAPYATSTPVKTVPSNLGIQNIYQKELLLHTPINIVNEFHNGLTTSNIVNNDSKRVGKNSSGVYLDILITSSSDEDESIENKKRPIIKLSSRKKTRSFLSIKKLGNKEAETDNKINPSNKISNSKKLETNTVSHVISTAKVTKLKIGQSPNAKDEPEHPTKVLHSSFKNSSSNSDEENKIFDETKSVKKSASRVKSCLKSNENLTKGSENLDKYEDQSVKSEAHVQVKSKRAIVTGEKGSSKTVSEGKKLSNVSKKRPKKVTNDTGQVKRTRSRKVQDKLLSEPVENTKSKLHIWEKKHNLSHQLFSDSREQECINMLDLTQEDVKEANETIRCSEKDMKIDSPVKTFKSPHPSIQNIPNIEIKKERPKRVKRIPKEFWLPETTPEKILDNVMKKRKKVVTKSNDLVQDIKEINKKEKDESTTKNKNNNNKTVRKQKGVTNGKKKAELVSEEKVIEGDKDLQGDTKFKDAKQNYLSHPSPKAAEPEETKPNQKDFEDENLMNKGKNPVFQRLNELFYEENENGCSVDQCWSIHKFKCGVFRLKVKDEISCKTLHKNSHLGGVLVKGELRMKIGEEELGLKEGDMAFVPPLTNWQATNIGDCESIFYYWCGRFGK